MSTAFYPRVPYVPRRHLAERHGEGCECLRLVSLVGGGPRTLPYSYCLYVLQRRWGITCQHGAAPGCAAVSGSVERWRQVGPLDGVKAILISNA